MGRKMNRRDFVRAGTVGSGGVKPVVIASVNGNIYKNGGDTTGVQKALTQMTRGSDVLDA